LPLRVTLLRRACATQGDEVSYLRYVLGLYKHKLADASARELELERRVSPLSTCPYLYFFG
jgi:hypothetical protein